MLGCKAVAVIFLMLINGTGVSLYTFHTGAHGHPVATVAGHLTLPPDMTVSQDIQDSVNFKLMYIHTSRITGMQFLTSITGVQNDDILYCPMPLYLSVAGLISLSGCMSSGITMVIRDMFSASQYFSDCVRYNVTVGQYIGELCRYILMSTTPVTSSDSCLAMVSDLTSGHTSQHASTSQTSQR